MRKSEYNKHEINKILHIINLFISIAIIIIAISMSHKPWFLLIICIMNLLLNGFFLTKVLKKA